MKDQPFFINIIPTNDRLEDQNYIETATLVMRRTNPDYFSYSLLTLGHNRFEPWVLAQYLMHQSENFNPLIAVGPSGQHPVNIVKKIASLQTLFKNKIALNLVPGSFSKEMESVNDISSFEQKQNELHEFSSIIRGFLTNKNVMSYDGLDYQLKSTRIFPVIQNDAVKLFFSGMGQSQRSGNEDSYFIKNIKPLSELPRAEKKYSGLALGVCARSTAKEADEAMKMLYPENRKGQMLFDMVISNNETPWNEWIKKRVDSKVLDTNDFNLYPMKNFWSAAPFISGSYEEVVSLLVQYHQMGYDFFVMDFHPDDFKHVEECIKQFRLKS